MRILHISPYLPSLEANHAGGVCMGKQIQALSEIHEVSVLSFVITKHDKKLAEKLQQGSAGDSRYYFISLSKLQKLFNIITHPWYPAYFSTRSSVRFKKALLSIVREKHIEAIHAEYASMGQYIWIKKLFPNIRFVLTEHDFTEQLYTRKIEKETLKIKRKFLQWQLKLIHHWEQDFCKNADVVITFNDKDQKLIETAYHLDNIRVMNPYYGIDSLIEKNKSQVVPNSICFVGQMGRFENHQAACRLIRIAQKVKEKIPDLQVYIIGNAPSTQLKKLADGWIYVTGFIEDIDAMIQKCEIAVFPLEFGAGIKLKVLRCLALGLPVITTDIGAEGIDEDGRVLFLARSDDEFQTNIEKLLENRALRKACEQNGREFVSRQFSWEVSRCLLKELYQ